MALPFFGREEVSKGRRLAAHRARCSTRPQGALIAPVTLRTGNADAVTAAVGLAASPNVKLKRTAPEHHPKVEHEVESLVREAKAGVPAVSASAEEPDGRGHA